MGTSRVPRPVFPASSSPIFEFPAAGNSIFFSDSSCLLAGNSIFFSDSSCPLAGNSIFFSDSSCLLAGNSIFFSDSSCPLAGNSVFFSDSSCPLARNSVLFSLSAIHIKVKKSGIFRFQLFHQYTINRRGGQGSDIPPPSILTRLPASYSQILPKSHLPNSLYKAI